jgi:hypothetical protein
LVASFACPSTVAISPRNPARTSVSPVTIM